MKKVKRYFFWLVYCYFAALVIFLIPWLSMNGVASPTQDASGLQMVGGIINSKGYTGDFFTSATASFIILVNIYHLIILIGTRHFSTPLIASFVISFVVYLVVVILDNDQSFDQTNLPFIFGSAIFPLSVILATCVVALPVYAVKSWEMVLYAPIFYQKEKEEPMD